MAKKPKYRRHPNGQAFVQNKSIDRPGHRLYLGVYGSEESLSRYRKFLDELEGGEKIEVAFFPGGTVEDLVAAYLAHCDSYYRDDGRATKESSCMGEALDPIARLFGDKPAVEFGPRDLQAYRESVMDRWSRNTINSHAKRVRRMFRWAVSNEYLPANVWHALQSVEGLKRGRTAAREAEPIPAVLWEAVEPFMYYFSPTVATMVAVQFWCGMRPQDVCRMRRCDLDTTGDVWLYTPPKHKNSWRGHSLTKAVPKRVQPLIASLFREGADEWLFSPADSLAWHAQQRAKEAGKERKTPIYPSELRSREKKKKSRIAKERRPYTTETYRQAIEYGQAKCNKKREEAALPLLPLWTPMQLRHGVATFVDRKLGRQAAQRYLGHKHLSTTEIYVERDAAELIEIARKLDEG